MLFYKSPNKVPKDLARSFRIRSKNMMKKSAKLTDVGARVALYMERGGERVVFQTHADLVPQWNTSDASHFTPADFPAEPDYDEFRNPSSSPWSSPAPAASPVLGSASLRPTARVTDEPSFSLPTLDTFSIPGLEDWQLTIPGGNNFIPDVVAMSPSDVLELDEQPGKKRQRPASLPVADSPRQKQRKRAKTSSWFE